MQLKLNLPKHKGSLTLEHNGHRSVYETAEKWIMDHDDIFDWKDEDAKQRAIATDEVWSLQWYPDTPVGFFAVAAPTLEELLELAKDSDTEDKLKPEAGIWWCNSHGRAATHTNKRGERCCDPKLGGILLPCRAIFAPIEVM